MANSIEAERREGNLQLGDPAPEFTLAILGTPETAERVSLSHYFGKRPVVLIFGSYT